MEYCIPKWVRFKLILSSKRPPIESATHANAPTHCRVATYGAAGQIRRRWRIFEESEYSKNWNIDLDLLFDRHIVEYVVPSPRAATVGESCELIQLSDACLARWES